jgi:hypothetical protein
MAAAAATPLPLPLVVDEDAEWRWDGIDLPADLVETAARELGETAEKRTEVLFGFAVTNDG